MENLQVLTRLISPFGTKEHIKLLSWFLNRNLILVTKNPTNLVENSYLDCENNMEVLKSYSEEQNKLRNSLATTEIFEKFFGGFSDKSTSSSESSFDELKKFNQKKFYTLSEVYLDKSSEKSPLEYLKLNEEIQNYYLVEQEIFNQKLPVTEEYLKLHEDSIIFTEKLNFKRNNQDLLNGIKENHCLSFFHNLFIVSSEQNIVWDKLKHEEILD